MFQISWLTSSYEKLTDNEQIMIDDDPRLSVNVIGDTSWNLLIENVNGEDSGTYICMVQAIPPQMKQVQLTVKGIFWSAHEMIPGSLMIFSCINTYPVPRKLFEHLTNRPSVQTSPKGPGKS